MIKVIFSIAIFSWNVIAATPIISKITFTEEELVIDGFGLENIQSLSIRDLEKKILKEYEIGNAIPEKIVARSTDGSFISGEKNLYLVITSLEEEIFYPITLKSKTDSKTVYKITKKKKEKVPSKIVVDEKSEINFSPSDNSGKYFYNYSIYANEVGDLAIKSDNKDLFKIDPAGNLEILGSLKVKGKTFKLYNQTFENQFMPPLLTNQIERNFRISDVVIGTDNSIVGVTNFSSSGNMDVATGTFHVDSATGRVGIGNSAPTYKLDVLGTDNSGIRLKQPSPATNTSSAFFNGMVFEGPVSTKLFGIGYGVGDLFSINSFDGNNYRNIFSLNNLGNGVISGSLKIGAYTLPSSDGVSGTILKTDGAGNISWSPGGGTVNGPGTTNIGNIASWNNTIGTLLDDGGKAVVNLVTNNGTSTNGFVATFADGTGKIIQNGTKLEADLVTGPTAASATDNLASFNGTTGKIIKDSGISSSNITTLTTLPTLANLMVLTSPLSKELIITPYTMPPVIGSPTYILKSDGTNVTWQEDAGAASLKLTKWEPNKAYKIDEIQFAGEDNNWLIRTATDTVSSDAWWKDQNAGKSIPIAPPLVTTGVITTAGVSTIAGSDVAGYQVNIRAGTGYIANYFESNSPYPTFQVIPWPETTIDLRAQPVGVYTIYVDNTGIPKAVAGYQKPEFFNQNISIAVADTYFGSIYDSQTFPSNPIGQIRELALFFGTMTKGLSYAGGATNTTQIFRSAYLLYNFGINTSISSLEPNSKDVPAESSMTFLEFTQTGPVSPTPRTTINTNVYDNGGTLGTLENNKYGFVRFYSNANGQDIVMYSQNSGYALLGDAEKAAIDPKFKIPERVAKAYIFNGYVAYQKGDANLVDNTYYSCNPFSCDTGGAGGNGSSTLLRAALGPTSSVQNRLAIFVDESGRNLAQSAFAVPTTPGTAGQVFTSNGDGTTKWGTLAVAPSRASLPSDKKLKKEIQNLSEGYIERLMNLRPVSFVWKDTLNSDIGFIAQEVKKIFPEFVEEDAGYIGVNYQKLVVPLIKAVQEQQKEIDQYKDAIFLLEERIGKLEKESQKRL